MSAGDILTALGLGGASVANSALTSSSINKITDAQLSANDKAALLYYQGADKQAQAMLEAAGISAEAAMAAAGITKEAYEKAIAQQQEAMAYQKEMYGEAKKFQQPFYKAGKWALKELKSMMKEWDGSVEAYEKSPYYDFIKNETIGALDSSAASKGKLQSGAQQQAIMQYGKDLASTDYDNWLQRYYDSLVPYQYMTGLGQNSANALTSAAIGNGNAVASTYGNISNLMGRSGEAQANYTNQAGNAQAQGVAGAGDVYGNLYNNLARLETDRGDISAYGEVGKANSTTNALNQIGGILGQYGAPIINAAAEWLTPSPSPSASTAPVSATNVEIPEAYANASQNWLSEYYL
jgi:alkylated DNA nucleotide flippase Atl1